MLPGVTDAVLLDLYDTLVWSRWSALRDALAARLSVRPDALVRGYEATQQARGVGTYRSAEGDIAATVEACGLDPQPALIAELTEMEREFLEGGVVLYEDSLPVARELRARGVRTAVVSNCSHATRTVVDSLALEDEFDAVVLSFEAGAMKPSAEIFRATLARLGDPDPGATVFVDDQAWYCDGAAALGLGTYLIARPNTRSSPDPPLETNGHAVIRDLAPLLD
jgi:putative hydrolase of the HAD superfamily